MSKLFLQFGVVVLIFFGLWSGLSNVNWVERFHVRQFTEKKQKQLGELVMKMQKLQHEEIGDTTAIRHLNTIIYKIASPNHIDTSELHVYLFKDDHVNAFALPGGNIIVNSSLIANCDNPDMLAGVLAHEIAHIEYGHVASKLAREIGLSTLMTITGDNMGVLKEILKTLTSTKFDREQETEADRAAVNYLEKAGIDPSQLGYFLNFISKQQADVPESLEWVSTHPNSAERAKKIIASFNSAKTYIPALDSTDWTVLKAIAEDN